MTGVEIEGALPLAEELRVAATRMLPGVRAVTRVNAGELQLAWRAGAKVSSGRHGKRYPLAITTEEVVTFGGATYDTGPEEGKRQGGMGRGFEYGSINQPPHLDGKHAADVQAPKFLSELELFVAGLL